jgi:type IV secretion system protein VirD4
MGSRDLTNTTTNHALPKVIGSTAPEAVTLGRSIDSGRHKLRYGGDQHILVFGPNGKGKSTGIVIPHLLQSSGSSIVVVDPKGELAAVTAEYRRTLGRVVILNPFALLANRRGYEDLKGCGFNPLARLNPKAESFNSDAAQLAEALVTIEGKDPHWSQSARSLIAALIMFEVLNAWDAKPRRTPALANVRKMLCDPVSPPTRDSAGTGLPKYAADMMDSKHAGLRNKAAQFTEWTKEVQSIASAAKIQTEPFDDVEIARNLAQDDFNFQDLKREPVTVYLTLPPKMVLRHAKWLRLVLTSAIQAVLRPRERGEPKVLFMLDEFFSLGHLESISTVWALARGYGVQMMPILQDLPQLKKLYPDMWETFIGMAGAVVSFGTNDSTTGEWLSRRMGQKSRLSISAHSGTSTAADGTESKSESLSYSTTTAPLRSAYQLYGLPKQTAIVSLDGLSKVLRVELPPYFDIAEADMRARDNPFYLG